MSREPRQQEDYGDRQIEAARRVLIDLGQILASFRECVVVVGGWVPDLLITDPHEAHIGSIDVDLALNAARLQGRAYADLLQLLFDTGRYRQGPKEFQLIVDVDLGDGEPAVQVDVEFLAPEGKLKKNRPKLAPGFRVLQTEGCSVAFHAPVETVLEGLNVGGAENRVRLQVASLPDFLIMKALAIDGRDKPKDSYDLCYTLENIPDGMNRTAADWRQRAREESVGRAVGILREKFASERSFGPRQVVEFHDAVDPEERERQAQRAYQVVSRFLELLGAVETHS